MFTLSDEISSRKWHRDDFILTLSGKENISSNTYYYGTKNNDITTIGTSIDVSTETSSYIYYAKICSSAGVCSSTSSYEIKLDKNPPSCSFSGESTSWTNDNRTIKATCSDSGSECTNGTASKQLTYTSGTIKTANLSYTITDNAGNSATCSKTANVYVDKDAPSVTCSIGSDNGYNSNNVFYAVCNDTGSGCINSASDSVYSEFYPRISGFGATTFVNVKMTPNSLGEISWNWPYTGYVTVTASYYDHVGNSSTCTQTVTG